MKTWITGEALKTWKPYEFVIPDINNKETFGFKCWEDFFLREFKEEHRPIEMP